MDQHALELLRRFEADPDDAGVIDQLMRTFAQAGRCAPPAVLRRTARWRPLVDFAARWFERPLADGDGCTEDELAATEARLGRRLPGALREWFCLVDRRLQGVLDVPTRLHELRLAEGGALTVWGENLGAWEMRVSADGGDDPPVLVLVDPTVYEGEPFTGRLVESLLSMVVSDTMGGAWSGEDGTRDGPLGPLAPAVRGGILEFADADAIPPEYGLLPGPGYPLFHAREHRPRGDATAVLRFTGPGVEWMTADDAAYQRLARTLDLCE